MITWHSSIVPICWPQLIAVIVYYVMFFPRITQKKTKKGPCLSKPTGQPNPDQMTQESQEMFLNQSNKLQVPDFAD